MNRKEWFTLIGFCTGIASLTTGWILPVLSVILALTAIVCSILARGAKMKGMVYAALGMGILALILDGIYYYVTMS